MASITLPSVAATFPEGTTVGAYPWTADFPPASGEPSVAATTTAAVAAAGTLAFTGLARNTRYLAAASVSGTWKYIKFSTPVAEDGEAIDVSGDVVADGDVTAGDDLAATDDLTVGDDAAVTGDLAVTGGATAADVTATDDLSVGDDATVTGDLAVTGNVAVNTNKFTVAASSGNALVAGTLAVTGASTLTGATAVTGDFAVNTNKLTVAASSGNTLVAGTLAVTGAQTFTGQTNIDGDLDHDGTNVGFYGVTPAARPGAITQTYATTTATHADMTSAAVATDAAGLTLYGYAEAQANAIPVAINALRADVINLKGVVNLILDGLQSQGLAQ